MKAPFDPKLSIGILAHNEELGIAKTLRSLFSQDVFQRCATEVVVVANGCMDGTAEVSRRLLVHHQAVWSAHGSARVEEISIAGKANAWNQFVHKFSSPLAPLLVLMDADITYLNVDTISSLVSTLKNNPQAIVCVDQSVKDIEIKTNRTLFERLLVSVTPKIDPDNVPLCGQLYCVRSEELRLIKLPENIICDDGFLRGLLLTRGFTAPEDRRRIMLDSSVGHSFASVATLSELFRHEKWIVAGSIVNMLLFKRLSAEASPHRSAMTLMKNWEEQDFEWLPRYVESQVRVKGWCPLPRSWWTRRWTRLSGLPTRLKLRRLPVVMIAAVVDAIIFTAAIRDVRLGRGYRYWTLR